MLKQHVLALFAVPRATGTKHTKVTRFAASLSVGCG